MFWISCCIVTPVCVQWTLSMGWETCLKGSPHTTKAVPTLGIQGMVRVATINTLKCAHITVVCRLGATSTNQCLQNSQGPLTWEQWLEAGSRILVSHWWLSLTQWRWGQSCGQWRPAHLFISWCHMSNCGGAAPVGRQPMLLSTSSHPDRSMLCMCNSQSLPE